MKRQLSDVQQYGENARKRQLSYEDKLRKKDTAYQKEKERADSVERELNEFKDKEMQRRMGKQEARPADLSDSSSSPPRNRPRAPLGSASSQDLPAEVAMKLDRFRNHMDWHDHALTAVRDGWTLVHHVCNGASPGAGQLPYDHKADGVDILDALLKAFGDMPRETALHLVSCPTAGQLKPCGWTALRFLANNKCEHDEHRHRMAQMLLDFKVDLETRMGNDAITVLMSAASTGNIPVLNMLLEARADVMAVNNRGSTLVDYSMHNNAVKEIFKSRGVKAETPLDGAGRRRRIISYFIHRLILRHRMAQLAGREWGGERGWGPGQVRCESKLSSAIFGQGCFRHRQRSDRKSFVVLNPITR